MFQILDIKNKGYERTAELSPFLPVTDLGRVPNSDGV